MNNLPDRNLRVLLLSDPSSPHTVRWVNSLSERGIDIYLFGLSSYNKAEYNPGIKIETMDTPEWIKIKFNGNLLKIIYLFKLPRIRKIIKEFRPDILHAHYVSSYGVLGALSGFHPFLISVWGIDIFLFPNVSFLHRNLVEYSLSKADRIFSTSYVMARETKKYTSKEIEVIPFGIEPDKFFASKHETTDEDIITIGTVKALERKYGIDKLITTFELLKKRNPELGLRLLLIGGGSLENKFRQMIKEKGLEKDTIFTGKVSHNIISDYHRKLDIAVYLSTTESFGVSVIESSACEIPVIVSDVGGLKEVVEDNQTGLIIPDGDPQKTCEAIEKLIFNENLRVQMGKAGRIKVLSEYNWNQNIRQMISNYNHFVSQERR